MERHQAKKQSFESGTGEVRSDWPPNLHYQFYEAYYQDALLSKKRPEAVVAAHNKNMCTKRVFGEIEKIDGRTNLKEAFGKDAFLKEFLLETQYPGLLTGLGEVHSAGIKGEIACGMTLDYVTGLPMIHGSSVKGVLRSHASLENGMVLRELLAGFCEGDFSELDTQALVTDIFGGSAEQKVGKETGSPKPKDVFFDAVLYNQGKNNAFLALDVITPHRQTELLELAEPNPITFLKIAPEVTVKFQFYLTNSPLYTVQGKSMGILCSQKKMELFRLLLCTFGIGAKTNVGYGILVEPQKERVK